MKNLKILLVSVLLIFSVACEKAVNQSEINNDSDLAIVEISEDKSLYNRLGGAEGISTIVDDIVEAHFNNEIDRKSVV